MPSHQPSTTSFRRLLCTAAALAAIFPCAVSAQEFFRDLGTSRSSGGFGPVVPSDYSYQETSPSGLTPLRPGQELTPEEQAEESDKYNFAVGPFRLSLAVGAGFEFNLAGPGSDTLLRRSSRWRFRKALVPPRHS